MRHKIYRALQECVRRGLVERIGLSNYTPEDYEELMASGVVTLAPVVNQIEASPFLYRRETFEFFRARGVVVQAFKPLQRGAALEHPVVGAIAARVGRSPAAVLVRWGVQKELSVLVKSSNPERLAANLREADAGWGLSSEDMAQLDALTTEQGLATAHEHYLKRRAGTPAPWGEGPRPRLEPPTPVESSETACPA